jgi:hypothetical protein
VWLSTSAAVEFATLSRKNGKTVFEVLSKDKTEELLKKGKEISEKEKAEKAAAEKKQ